MREILLTQGKIAIVDDEDYEKINRQKWCACRYRKTFYAIRKKNNTNSTVYMHRLIMNMTDNRKIDHRDNNGLNNQKENLRVCSDSENKCNRGKTCVNSVGFKGVTPRRKKFVAQIRKNNKNYYLGIFSSVEEAASAYDKAANLLHGDFAKT